MKKSLIALFVVAATLSQAQTAGEKVAKTAMTIWKDSFSSKWSYDMGVILKGMEGMWYRTGDVKYFDYIQKQVDFYIPGDGSSIKSYKPDEYNIDHINNGKLLLLLYRVTEKEKYWKAAKLIREQLKTHPRTKEGGFWHKKVYPYQMWLDGLYMGEPFYAEYAMYAGEDSIFNDVANQFIWMEKHARDEKTGLLYHAWDESKEQQWANKTTGTSPHFWARAMGWYADALIDALEYFPNNHPKKKELIAILNRLVNAVAKQQDKTTGLWYDVMNYNGSGKEKNYVEASASCQFVYAIAKGVRRGYLPQDKLAIATSAYAGILKNFIKEEGGQTNLHGTVSVSGLGGKPYRDGSFEYYMSEKVIVNDPKGIGAFLLAANEMDLLANIRSAQGKNVVLDSYFNSERRKNIAGKENFWHYTWDEKSNGGFSLLGELFRSYGATTKTLYEAPTQANLKLANVYIIVDADNKTDNPKPNYVTEKDAAEVYRWVKAGGTLVLLHNDKPNAEFEHFNILAKKFGIEFNEDSRNHVEKNQYEQGALYIKEPNPVFKSVKKIYLKEISTLKLSGTAKAIYTDKGDVLMATNNIGLGRVFAVGDPWFYNEYIDGRRLSPDFENFKAADDLVQWALKVVKK
jgi:unsaturated rhamnogalacturonyl hydrolase